MAREEQVKQTIAAAKQQGAKLVIVAFHWGTEKATEPDETQKSLAHTAIDCGADLVVGHHPHVLQAIEYYKGKYIAYSLGNFCFGGNSAPSDMDTMIFQQTFTIEKGRCRQMQLQRWCRAVSPRPQAITIISRPQRRGMPVPLSLTGSTR